MHPNPAFRNTDAARSLALVRARSFGTLAVNGPNGPCLSHVPFELSDDAQTVDLHLVRTNAIARLLECPQPAVLSVMGADGYISPDWYGLPDQVPTWNYVAVHLRGPIAILPQEALRPLLDRLSEHFEARLSPKPVWRSAKMTPGVMDRMMRALVPCRLTVAVLDSTWKLGQNKPDAARLAAADHVRAPELAALMRTPPGG